MKQIISIFKRENDISKYIEYEMTADNSDILTCVLENDVQAEQMNNSLQNKICKVVNHLKEQKIVSLRTIFELIKSNATDQIDFSMLDRYLSCFDIKRKFEIESDRLAHYQRSILKSNIVTPQDIEELETNIQAAVYNTNVLATAEIDLDKVEKKSVSNEQKDVSKIVVLETQTTSQDIENIKKKKLS